MKPKSGGRISGAAISQLKHETFWGREKENLIYPIGLANLILHAIDRPNIWHGNALTKHEVYGGLFAGAPSQFDVVLTNPPFGGKESVAAQTHFAYRTSATQVLFLQHVIEALKTGGRCGMVIDEGVLFRTNEDAFVKTKRKLTDECDLWCVLSLPGGVFSTAGAGVKTNLLFFTKGKPTERIWYYDLSDVKVGKKSPLTLKHFEDFAVKLADRVDSDRSWTVDLVARRAEATEEARPFRETARTKTREAEAVKNELAGLKKAKPRDEAAVAAFEETARDLFKQAREATNKADDIENAVYDLKAVNPHRRPEIDRKTPTELLDLVEAKGVEIAAALKALRVSGSGDHFQVAGRQRGRRTQKICRVLAASVVVQPDVELRRCGIIMRPSVRNSRIPVPRRAVACRIEPRTLARRGQLGSHGRARLGACAPCSSCSGSFGMPLASTSRTSVTCGSGWPDWDSALSRTRTPRAVSTGSEPCLWSHRCLRPSRWRWQSSSF
jgi:hypothetical protein